MINLDHLLDNDELDSAQQRVVRRFFNYDLKPISGSIKVYLKSKKNNKEFRVHWIRLNKSKESKDNVYKRAMFHIIEDNVYTADPKIIKKIHKLLSSNFVGIDPCNHLTVILNTKKLIFPHPSDIKSQILWQAVQLLGLND